MKKPVNFDSNKIARAHLVFIDNNGKVLLDKHISFVEIGIEKFNKEVDREK